MEACTATLVVAKESQATTREGGPVFCLVGLTKGESHSLTHATSPELALFSREWGRGARTTVVGPVIEPQGWLPPAIGLEGWMNGSPDF